MPPGELIALRWSDIDFESSSVKVTKSTCRTNGKMITKTTKTGATREIAVPELICKMARQWQIEQLRQQLFPSVLVGDQLLIERVAHKALGQKRDQFGFILLCYPI